MGERTPTIETACTGDLAISNSADTNPRGITTQKSGKILEVGKGFIKTVHHFWPDLPAWIAQLPDTRFMPFVQYKTRFMFWYGVMMFNFELGSRRQLNSEVRDDETEMLGNLNRLASSDQESLPVDGTLTHFLGHVGWEPFELLQMQFIRRLIRMKSLDDYRLKGKFVIAVDGTEHLAFHYKHCTHCIKRNHHGTIVYHHPVLEAKIVSVSGMALSIASEFIQNSDLPDPSKAIVNYEEVKQDCELKAFVRLAIILKTRYPQTPLCITGDSLFFCGAVIISCNTNHWSYVLVFKQGRTPALWDEFIRLLALEKDNYRQVVLPNNTTQQYQWINGLPYEDSEGRKHIFNAILCKETVRGKTTTFAWGTDIEVTYNNVSEIASKGGRSKWDIEEEFNNQKNSGLNMEHPYSTNETVLKAFYLLLQIASTIQQLFEKGSLLKNLALSYGKKSVVGLFGSNKNISRRLLECFRNFCIPEEAFDSRLAALYQIRFDSS